MGRRHDLSANQGSRNTKLTNAMIRHSYSGVSAFHSGNSNSTVGGNNKNPIGGSGGSGSGSSSLSGLSDTTISSVIDKEIISFDNASSKWINKTYVEAGLPELDNSALQAWVGSNDFSGSVVLRDSLIISNQSVITKQAKFDLGEISAGNIRTLKIPDSSGTIALNPTISDIDAATFDLKNLDRLLFDQTDGSSLLATNVGITSSSSKNMDFNVPTTSAYTFSENDILQMKLSNISNVATLQLVDSLGAELRLAETTSNKVAQILKGTSSLLISDPDRIDFVIGVTKMIELTSTGIHLEDKSMTFGAAKTSSISEGILVDTINFATASSVRMTIGNTAISPAVKIHMSNLNKIEGVLDPTNPQDVVTKAYGDANYLGGGTPKKIVDVNSFVVVANAGGGAVGFTLDGESITTVTPNEWLFGNNLNIDNNEIQNPNKIVMKNGFEIVNTNATTTTFAIFPTEVLKITEGVDTRLQIDKNITLDCDTDDKIIFKGNNMEVGRYDDDTKDWFLSPQNNVVLNPSNDVTLSPTLDINLTPTRNVILNPTGQIKVFNDIDMEGVSRLNFSSSASVPPGSASGAIQVKIDGIIKLIKFYNP